MTKNSKVKILVGYHKPAELLKSSILVPIHLGRELARNKWLLVNTIGDNTGDNISSRNRTFCELTGIYWAWKNYETLGNPDYIGFMHYRRIFDFKNESINYPINKTRNLPQVEYFSKQQGIWDTEFVKTFITKNEYVISKHHNGNPIEHFARSKWCQKGDLQLAINAIKSVCPQFLPYAEKYLSHDEKIFFNMFIMPKTDFFQYAEFIFNILFDIEEKIDLRDAKFPAMRKRALAMIAEQLTGIFFTYLGSQHRVTELPVIYAEHPEIKNAGELYFQEEGVVPIVFITDQNYYLYVGVAIQSIIENKKDKTKYDILILAIELTSFQKEKFKKFERSDLQIHVLDVFETCKKYGTHEFMTIHHLSHATYIRLLLCEILKNYHKVIYLDCDLIVLTDLADIFHNTDLSHEYAAVVKDYLICNVFGKRPTFKNYMKDVLHIDDLSMYFNSGVMVLNLDSMREDNIQDKLLKVALINNKFFHDQNVLNSVLYKKVIYLNGSYNVNYFLYFSKRKSAMPKSFFEEFRNPKILHFSSCDKPWNKPDLPAADLFWHYARLTPLYEEIIYTNFRDILTKVFNYKKLVLRLYYYRFLSKVTFGKKREKYLGKKRDIKEKIYMVRQFLK